MLVFQFIKQTRVIKTETSSLWVGGEIMEGMVIVVRHTFFKVKNVVRTGNVVSIYLTDVESQTKKKEYIWKE